MCLCLTVYVHIQGSMEREEEIIERPGIKEHRKSEAIFDTYQLEVSSIEKRCSLVVDHINLIQAHLEGKKL